MAYVLSKENSVPLRSEVGRFFIEMAMMEATEGKKAFSQEELNSLFEGEETPFPIGVVAKRLEVLKLPIQFTKAAWSAFTIFPDRVGGVVLMLIDLLTEYENQLVGLADIIEMYPYGFYNEEALMDRIDNHVKKGEFKYSFVY